MNKIVILLMFLSLFSCNNKRSKNKPTNFKYDTTYQNEIISRVDIVHKNKRYPILINDSLKGIYWKGSWKLVNDVMHGDIVCFNAKGDTSYTTQYEGLIDHGIQQIYKNNKVIEIDSINNGGLVYVRNLKNGEIDSSKVSLLFIPLMNTQDTILIDTNLCIFSVKVGNPIYSNLNLIIKSGNDTIFNKVNKSFYEVELDFRELPYGILDAEILLLQNKDFDKGENGDKKSISYISYYNFIFDNQCGVQ